MFLEVYLQIHQGSHPGIQVHGRLRHRYIARNVIITQTLIKKFLPHMVTKQGPHDLNYAWDFHRLGGVLGVVFRT
jgi:hypothetical protein